MLFALLLITRILKPWSFLSVGVFSHSKYVLYTGLSPSASFKNCRIVQVQTQPVLPRGVRNSRSSSVPGGVSGQPRLNETHSQTPFPRTNKQTSTTIPLGQYRVHGNEAEQARATGTLRLGPDTGKIYGSPAWRFRTVGTTCQPSGTGVRCGRKP